MKDMAEQTPAASQERVESLTPRETEVLTYIAEGFTSREIADTLVISVKTVERHRENIMTKLDIHNRVELVKFAIRKGLIQPE
ncbi:MAG: response regulator transcription factor, partial [Caldilineaceae bacterium]|nr:response regulator transcription factor [Caldilineaceae bacterium]